MPILSVYLGSSVISAGLIYMPQDVTNAQVHKNAFTTLPYPPLSFHTMQEQKQFVENFLNEFVASVDASLNIQNVPTHYTVLVNPPSYLTANTPQTQKEQKALSVPELYMGDTSHVFCANSFYFHAGKLIYANPYPKYTTDIYNEAEKINILFNLEVYPFNYPFDEFSQGLYDDAILYLQHSLTPKAQTAKVRKQKKEHFSKARKLELTGDRFTYYKHDPESTYFLALSLLDEFGIFNLTLDTNNVATHALNYAKNYATLSDEQLNYVSQNSNAVINAGSVIKFAGSAECLFESQVGTKQLFQLNQNQIQIIPLSAQETAKVTLKGSGLDTIEATVTGGELGVVFYNFEPSFQYFAGLQAGFAKDIKNAIRESLAKF